MMWNRVLKNGFYILILKFGEYIKPFYQCFVVQSAPFFEIFVVCEIDSSLNRRGSDKSQDFRKIEITSE